jgi:hypothetical protein
MPPSKIPAGSVEAERGRGPVCTLREAVWRGICAIEIVNATFLRRACWLVSRMSSNSRSPARSIPARSIQAAPGRTQSILEVPGRARSIQAVPDRTGSILAVTGPTQSILAVPGRTRSILAVSSRARSILAMAGNPKSPNGSLLAVTGPTQSILAMAGNSQGPTRSSRQWLATPWAPLGRPLCSGWQLPGPRSVVPS